MNGGAKSPQPRSSVTSSIPHNFEFASQRDNKILLSLGQDGDIGVDDVPSFRWRSSQSTGHSLVEDTKPNLLRSVRFVDRITQKVVEYSIESKGCSDTDTSTAKKTADKLNQRDAGSKNDDYGNIPGPVSRLVLREEGKRSKLLTFAYDMVTNRITHEGGMSTNLPEKRRHQILGAILALARVCALKEEPHLSGLSTQDLQSAEEFASAAENLIPSDIRHSRARDIGALSSSSRNHHPKASSAELGIVGDRNGKRESFGVRFGTAKDVERILKRKLPMDVQDLVLKANELGVAESEEDYSWINPPPDPPPPPSIPYNHKFKQNERGFYEKGSEVREGYIDGTRWPKTTTAYNWARGDDGDQGFKAFCGPRLRQPHGVFDLKTALMLQSFLEANGFPCLPSYPRGGRCSDRGLSGEFASKQETILNPSVSLKAPPTNSKNSLNETHVSILHRAMQRLLIHRGYNPSVYGKCDVAYVEELQAFLNAHVARQQRHHRNLFGQSPDDPQRRRGGLPEDEEGETYFDLNQGILATHGELDSTTIRRLQEFLLLEHRDYYLEDSLTEINQHTPVVSNVEDLFGESSDEAAYLESTDKRFRYLDRVECNDRNAGWTAAIVIDTHSPPRPPSKSPGTLRELRGAPRESGVPHSSVEATRNMCRKKAPRMPPSQVTVEYVPCKQTYRFTNGECVERQGYIAPMEAFQTHLYQLKKDILLKYPNADQLPRKAKREAFKKFLEILSNFEHREVLIELVIEFAPAITLCPTKLLDITRNALILEYQTTLSPKRQMVVKVFMHEDADKVYEGYTLNARRRDEELRKLQILNNQTGFLTLASGIEGLNSLHKCSMASLWPCLYLTENKGYVNLACAQREFDTLTKLVKGFAKGLCKNHGIDVIEERVISYVGFICRVATGVASSLIAAGRKGLRLKIQDRTIPFQAILVRPLRESSASTQSEGTPEPASSRKSDVQRNKTLKNGSARRSVKESENNQSPLRDSTVTGDAGESQEGNDLNGGSDDVIIADTECLGEQLNSPVIFPENLLRLLRDLYNRHWQFLLTWGVPRSIVTRFGRFKGLHGEMQVSPSTVLEIFNGWKDEFALE